MQFLFGVWVLPEEYWLWFRWCVRPCQHRLVRGFQHDSQCSTCSFSTLAWSRLLVFSWCRQPNVTHSHLHAVRGRLPSYYFRGWLVLSTMMVQVVCYGFFWEIPSGNVPVFSAIWFDNGYSLRQLTRSCRTRVLLTCPLLCWTIWSRQF